MSKRVIVAAALSLAVACSAPPLAPCTTCNGECVDVRVDSRNCGACGTACAAGSVCRNSACEASCATGLTVCSSRCTDTRSDPVNCGACGTACTADQVCRASMCQSVCPISQTTCGTECVTLTNNNQHCGSCNRMCAPGERCVNNSCESACSIGQLVCDGGICVNAQADNANCGACGRACAIGQICAGSQCVSQCASNQTLCDGGVCVNSQTDLANCGVCGRACTTGQLCSNGTCGTTCAGSLATCDPMDGGARSCADTQNDNLNCGTCYFACPGGQQCVGGTCRSFCAAGLTVCPGAAGAPLCTNTQTDTTNCGMCGRTCADACVGGACVPSGATALMGQVNLSTQNLGARGCSQGGEMVAYRVSALSSLTATVTVVPDAGCLATGDEVLLINQQSVLPSAVVNVGNWELLRVASVSASTVTFTAAKTKFYGDGVSDDLGVGTNQRVVLQRVPLFNVFAYQALPDGGPGVLTADGWNGNSGGVFALRAVSSININGVLDMKAKGFNGAPFVTLIATSGRRGDGPAGTGQVDDKNLMGAGGGGRGDFLCSTGDIPFGTAGGGAGHASFGGGASVECGGGGGEAIGTTSLGRIFMGPGGGAGGTDNSLTDNPRGGFGGRGGGIVLLLGPQLLSSGTIDVSGSGGEGDPQPLTVCPVPTHTGVCWDFSGPGGGGAGGTFYTNAGFFGGANTVHYGGGKGGSGVTPVGGTGAGNAGNGSAGRLIPMPKSCSEINPAMGDGEHLLAFDGDPARPYWAYCNAGLTYLTLRNTNPAGQTLNFSRYIFGGTVITRFTRVRFDPNTRRIIPNDFRFSTSTGMATGGPLGTPILTEQALGSGGDCGGGGSATGGGNIDLRGLPFILSTNNLWQPQGAGPGGTTTFSVGRQVLDFTGGGNCGDNSPRTFPNGEIELSYQAPLQSCAAIKTANTAYPDGVYAVSPGPSLPVVSVYCELQGTQGGGWTLIQANSDGGTALKGIQLYSEAYPLNQQGPGWMPLSLVRALSANATQVHMRARDLSRHVTSVASSSPILNLRGGLQLTGDPWALPDWTGPSTTIINRTCAVAPKGWPQVYHSCGSAMHMHWVVNQASWTNAVAADMLELYIK